MRAVYTPHFDDPFEALDALSSRGVVLVGATANSQHTRRYKQEYDMALFPSVWFLMGKTMYRAVIVFTTFYITWTRINLGMRYKQLLMYI
jgi:hypothetical protein